MLLENGVNQQFLQLAASLKPQKIIYKKKKESQKWSL